MTRWERREVVVRTTATGHELTAPVFLCHGRNESPCAYLQANVHGAELQGNAALLALFDILEKESPRGSLVIVPRVNPVSANQQVGDYVAGVYDFQTGNNFNRGYLNLTGPSRSSSSACYVDVDSFASVNQGATIREIRDGFREALRAALSAMRSVLRVAACRLASTSFLRRASSRFIRSMRSASSRARRCASRCLASTTAWSYAARLTGSDRVPYASPISCVSASAAALTRWLANQPGRHAFIIARYCDSMTSGAALGVTPSTA